MIGCQLHRILLHFTLILRFLARENLKFVQGKVREFKIVLKLQCVEFCREIKEYNIGFCSYEPSNFADNDTLTFKDFSKKVCDCIHVLYLSMTTLMHSKESNCHLTLNTFTSIVEYIRHLKVVSCFLLIRSQVITSD